LHAYKLYLNHKLVTFMLDEIKFVFVHVDGCSLLLRSLTKDFQILGQWLLLKRVWEMTSTHQGMIMLEYVNERNFA